MDSLHFVFRGLLRVNSGDMPEKYFYKFVVFNSVIYKIGICILLRTVVAEGHVHAAVYEKGCGFDSYSRK